jgi:uncharacterized protein YjbI with pentapeptide repeats
MMDRRLGRVAGSLLVLAAALALPVAVVVTAIPAAADTVVDGCTIVSNPTPTNFTDCPNTVFPSANLHDDNLSYANLAGSSFAQCGNPDTSPPCTSSDLSNADLFHADLEGVSFADCQSGGPEDQSCGAASLQEANLQGADLGGAHLWSALQQAFGPVEANFEYANLTNANLAGADTDEYVDFTGANLSGANLTNDTLADTLTDANLTDANLTGATFYETLGYPTPAILTGANFTGTILVPPNQSATATGPTGATVTWSTPAALPGATPGSCTPPSGSTFPLFTSTVTCQVVDGHNDVATGTFQVTVQPTSQYSTRVAVPANGATLSGSTYLDALAGDTAGITKVVFELSGGTLSDQVVATGSPSLYGWLVQWNSATVPNGTYSLQSVATDAANNTSTSAPVSVTITNAAPTTTVLLPSNGATVSGSTYLDASATSGVTNVAYELSGGPSNLSDQVIATAAATYYGWLATWNTTSVPNGTYSLQSVASAGGGPSGTSAAVSITVANTAPTTTVLVPANGASLSGTATVLDASAGSGVTSVTYELSGGPSNLNDQVIATATPTYYGWYAPWNTTSVPDGTYSLQSVAAYSGGVSGTSPPVSVTVAN